MILVNKGGERVRSLARVVGNLRGLHPTGIGLAGYSRYNSWGETILRGFTGLWPMGYSEECMGKYYK